MPLRTLEAECPTNDLRAGLFYCSQRRLGRGLDHTRFAPARQRSALPGRPLNCILAVSAAANLGISPAVASLLALFSAILAGAAKKVADAAGFGTPELRDFLNTAAGGLVAATGVLFAMVAIASDQFQAVETTASLLPIALLTSVPIAIHLLR